MNPLLLPVVAVQGAWVRRKMTVLPEASGSATGLAHGVGETPLRLAVLGESTAAGCGAPTHEEAFPGAFARALAQRENRSVQWSVHARNGATIRRVRYRILPEFEGRVDLAVLMIGVNDVLSRNSVEQWRQDMSAVLDSLAVKATLVIVAGIPPFDEFPSFPNTLRSFLDEQALALDGVARELCETRPNTLWIGSKGLGLTDAAFFATDGFHPSSIGYHRWAQGITERLPAVF